MSIFQSSMSTELKPNSINKTKNKKGLNLTGCMQTLQTFLDNTGNINKLLESQQINKKKAITVTMSTTERKEIKNDAKNILDSHKKKLGGVKLCSQPKLQISNQKQNLEELFKIKINNNLPTTRFLESHISQEKRNRNASHSLTHKRKPSLQLSTHSDLLKGLNAQNFLTFIPGYLKNQRNNSNILNIQNNNKGAFNIVANNKYNVK